MPFNQSSIQKHMLTCGDEPIEIEEVDDKFAINRERMSLKSDS